MRNVLICSFVLGLWTCGYGQYGRLKGSEFVQGQLGFTDAGVMVAGRYIYNYESLVAGEFGVGVAHGSLAEVKLTTVFADGIGSFGVLNKGQAFYLNMQAGISVAGDILNDFPTERISKRMFLTYGLTGGFAGELKIIRSLSLILEGQQRYYFKPTFSEKSRWRFNASAGIRLSI